MEGNFDKISFWNNLFLLTYKFELNITNSTSNIMFQSATTPIDNFKIQDKDILFNYANAKVFFDLDTYFAITTQQQYVFIKNFLIEWSIKERNVAYFTEIMNKFKMTFSNTIDRFFDYKKIKSNDNVVKDNSFEYIKIIVEKLNLHKEMEYDEYVTNLQKRLTVYEEYIRKNLRFTMEMEENVQSGVDIALYKPTFSFWKNKSWNYKYKLLNKIVSSNMPNSRARDFYTDKIGKKTKNNLIQKVSTIIKDIGKHCVDNIKLRGNHRGSTPHYMLDASLCLFGILMTFRKVFLTILTKTMKHVEEKKEQINFKFL